MANKFDLVSYYQSMTDDTKMAYSIGGAVPAGKTRFVTYIRIERTEEAYPSDCSGLTGVLGVASNLTALSAVSAIAAVLSGAVLEAGLAQMSAGSGVSLSPLCMMNQIPDRPNMDHPLLSLGSGKYLYYGLTKAPAASIFVQYYDE